MTTNKQTKHVLPNFVSSSNYCMKISKCQESTEHGDRSSEWYLSKYHNITSSHNVALACNSNCTFTPTTSPLQAKLFYMNLPNCFPHPSRTNSEVANICTKIDYTHCYGRRSVNLDKPYTHQRHRLHCHHPNPKSMSQGSIAKHTST